MRSAPIIALSNGQTKGMGFHMTSIAAETGAKTNQKAGAHKMPGEVLDQRYRQIGIPAVAAAARYHGAATNPAYAPAAIKWDRADDAA